MIRRLPWIAPLALSLLPAAASAAPPSAPRIDPAIDRALHAGIPASRAARMHRAPAGKADVVLELDRAPDTAMLDRLRQRGAVLRQVQGAYLRHGRFVPARVDAPTIDALSTLPGVRRIALAPPRSPLPMDHSSELIALSAARGARPALDLLTGDGIVVADLDSNAEVFHPQFFRADAGWFDWIDTNHNGVLDPGVDAIDLDRDGKANSSEKATLLKQQTMYAWYGDFVKARPDGFDPSIDWLYLDANGNGARDYGKSKGFDDSVPAFGEPLFVPDDVNLNGRVDIGERVARLGSSKFKKVYVHIENWGDVDHVFERGVDLSTHRNNYTDGAYGYDEALHGSGVLSIVAGDVPLIARRWVGLAPDADLLLGYELSSSSAGALTWALEQKPDVVLHETANWTGIALDGSDVMSSMVDESAVEESVTHSCPVGNTGGGRKHAHLTVPAAGEKTFTFDIPDFGASGPAQYVELSLNVRGAENLPVKVVEPGGQSYSFTKSGSGFLSNQGAYWLTTDKTSRGTYFFDLWLYADDPKTAPVQGTWTVTVTGDPQKEAIVDAYLMDDVSSWGLGVAFPESIATDDRTIGVPATADHCIAVGAHTGHPMSAAEPWFGDSPEKQGEVRLYSGRGPRIDGVQKPDVVAPDNPFVAAPYIVGGAYGDTPYGGVWPFGGTSGAGPHVTGVTVMLAQAGIRGDAAREAIRKGAVSDAITGTIPNHDYGWGRLSAAGVFGVPVDGKPPTLTLSAVPAGAAEGEPVELRPVVTDPDGAASAVELKWDDGYDGTWDTSWATAGMRAVTKKTSAPEPFKARARDATGRVCEAVIWVDEPLPAQPDAGAVDAGTEPGIPATSPAKDDDGCGCSMVGADRSAGWLLGVLSGSLLIGARRRRTSAGRR